MICNHGLHAFRSLFHAGMHMPALRHWSRLNELSSGQSPPYMNQIRGKDIGSSGSFEPSFSGAGTHHKSVFVTQDRRIVLRFNYCYGRRLIMLSRTHYVCLRSTYKPTHLTEEHADGTFNSSLTTLKHLLYLQQLGLKHGKNNIWL